MFLWEIHFLLANFHKYQRLQMKWNKWISNTTHEYEPRTPKCITIEYWKLEIFMLRGWTQRGFYQRSVLHSKTELIERKTLNNQHLTIITSILSVSPWINCTGARTLRNLSNWKINWAEIMKTNSWSPSQWLINILVAI